MKYSLWLANIPGIGNFKIQQIRNQCQTAESAYGCTKEQLEKIPGLSPGDITSILETRDRWNLDKEYGKLLEKGVSFVSMDQTEYPQKLRNIINGPYGIYYKGKLPDPDRKMVAIVGARGRSAYGSTLARKLGESLGDHGIDVISGMARGIDSDGQAGALAGQGRTFAVLGCGVDICYPAQNRYLYDEILEEGGILSEYPVGTQPRATLFPARNRIISALSDYVVVVEARMKSGSLITADFAMEQGKEVYAMPGRIVDELSQGCNRLIEQGAHIFTGIDDFILDIKRNEISNYSQMELKQFLMSPDELEIYSLIEYDPVGLGSLVEQSAKPLGILLELLRALQEKGYVKEIATNYFVRELS